MQLRLGTAALVAFLAGATAAASALVAGHAPPAPPVGLVFTSGSGAASGYRTLTRLDPVTRAPLGRSLPISEWAGGASFSPDRRQLALEVWRRGNLKKTAIVDLVSMRHLRDSVGLEPFAWLARERLVGFRPQLGAFVAVDPVSGQSRTGSRAPAGWYPDTAASAGGARPVLIAYSVGKASAAVVDANAHARFVPISVPDSVHVPASIAVDPAGRRVFFAGHGGPIAELDLGTMRVGYHTLSPPNPAGDGATGLYWLGDDTLAAYGYTMTERDAGNGFPDGLRLIDTRSWRSRSIDAAATGAYLVGDRLVSCCGGWDASRYALAGYSLRGERAFGIDAGARWEGTVDSAGSYLYLPVDSTPEAPAWERHQPATVALDTRDGTIVKQVVEAQPTRILDPRKPCAGLCR